MDYPFSLYPMTNTNSTTDHHPQEPKVASRVGRKPGDEGNKRGKKKVPQRGMGVAQLEKLRMKEMMKSMAESSSSEMDPTLATRMKMANLLALPPSQATPFKYPQGFYYGVPVVGSGGGGGGGERGLGSDRAVVSPFASYNVGGGSLPGFGATRELSSMPNQMTTLYHQHHNAGFQCCDVCLKMQKVKVEEEKRRRYYEKRENFNLGQASSSYGYGYGLINQQTNTLFNGDISGFSTRAARSALYANQISNQAVGPNSSAGGGRTLKEYEFFPGKRGKRSHHLKENEHDQAGSCVTTSENYTASNGSNYIDLSLKLSC